MKKPKEEFIEEIRKTAKNIYLREHALKRCIQRGIDPKSIQKEIEERSELIEYYPDDPHGPSGLLLVELNSKTPLHIVCSPRKSLLYIVSIYKPDLNIWKKDWRTRRRKKDEDR